MKLEVMAQKTQLIVDTFPPTIEKLTILTTISNESKGVNPVHHAERDGISVPSVAPSNLSLFDPPFNQPSTGFPKALVTFIDKLARAPDGIIEIMKMIIP